MENKQPKVSIIMSTFNRSEMVKETIDSILNQTYQNWEFFITDNGSSDDTSIVLEEYAAKDSRIKFLKNETNIYYGYHFKKGVELATGKYIARIDDDDIALPTRLEKQVKYMEENPEIALLGTYITPFGDIEAKSWITEFDSDILSVAMHFYNPICHSSVMMRKGFLDEHKLNYNTDALYAEDYWLWKDILINGGKIANYPEELLKYRFHKKAASQVSNSSIIQDRVAENVREELLNRFYNDKKIVTQIREKICKYPFTNNNKKQISNVLEQMKKYPNLISKEAVEKFEKRFCGIKSTMEIFFASDNNFVQHLCVAIASILKNSLPIEDFNFYILDGGIKEKNKKKIEELKKIKNFNIEFIKMDDSMFENCPITAECQHISKQTYYRYLIPKIKPNLEKCFYFDCDIVIKDSLNEFWNINLNDNYAAVIEELYNGANSDIERLNIDNYFNAGILLINAKKWNEENLIEKLFQNTVKLYQNGNLKWQDQDVLNYTFKDKVKWMSYKYNLQCNAFYDGKYECDIPLDMHVSKNNPTIIHFNSYIKPWQKNCRHPLWMEYYNYLKFTPFKKDYIKFKIKHKIKPKFKKIVENIFSIKNNGIHKNICFFGLKLKIKSKKLIERAKYEKLLNEFAYTRDCLNNKIDIAMKENQELTHLIENNLKTFIQEKSDHLNYQIKWNVGEQIGKSLSVYNLHQKVFPKYKNINEGKDVVLVATGPTLNYFDGIKNAVNIGVNSACCQDKIILDCLFAIDYPNVKGYEEKLINYRRNKCKKFFGIPINQFDGIYIPDEITTLANAERYYIDYNNFEHEENFYPDLSTSALPGFWSVSFMAINFALWTKPKKIYIVGCDESYKNHFDGSELKIKEDLIVEQHKIKHFQGWNKLKYFAAIYYPETEIISVNPVGLKGLFKDVYTESYLAEHPEIREEFKENIEILSTKEMENV